MKKTLLTLVMMVACFATAFAGEVIFDFTNPQALTPSITPSEEPSTGVDLSATPFTNGAVSISFVKGSAENDLAARIWTNTAAKNLSKELRAYKNSTITITTTSENITSIVFTGKKNSSMTTAEGVFSKGEWTGSDKSVTFNVTGTLNIENIKIVLGAGGEVNPEPQPEPQPEATVYSTIAELKKNAVKDGADIVYEFKDLLVTGKAGDDIYVTDGNEATLFYGSANTLNVGDKISGKVKALLVSYWGLTELKNVVYDDVKVVSSNNVVTPLTLTLADLAAKDAFAKYESVLVTVKGIKVDATAFDNFNINMVDGTSKVTLRDNEKQMADFKFDMNKSYDVVGVVGQFKGYAQVNLLNAEGIQEATATGIEGVEAAEGAQVIYDLSGRRVAKAVKGLYIINGKKVYVK